MKITQEPTDFRPIYLTLETGTEALCLFDIVDQFAREEVGSPTSCKEQRIALAKELAGMLLGCLGGDPSDYEKKLEQSEPGPEITVSKEPVSEYPKLMISDLGRVVAFIKDYTGVLVSINANEVFHEIGRYSDSWHMGSFKDYKPEVEFPRIVECDGLVVCATEINGSYFSGYVLEDRKNGYKVGQFDDGWHCSAFGL